MGKKRNVMLIGFMGTGKSTVAKMLGSRWGFEVVEMDALIEEREGRSINEIFAEHGEAYFRDVETSLLKEAAEKEQVVVSCGGGIVLREENIRVMKEHGTVVLLSAEPGTVYGRVCGNTDRPLLKNHMSVEKIAEMMESRREAYQKAADLTIVTDGKSTEEICDEAAVRINKVL